MRLLLRYFYGMWQNDTTDIKSTFSFRFGGASQIATTAKQQRLVQRLI